MPSARCSAGPEALVIVPNRAAVRQIDRTVSRSPDGGPRFLTRDELYDELHARLGGPRRLTAFEREAIAQSAAVQAANAAPELPFRVRPGLVAEMLKFYDHLRRQSQAAARFGELIEQAIGTDTSSDRGRSDASADAVPRARLCRVQERATASGAYDEHLLRARLIEKPLSAPPARMVVTVADWIADPDGLFVADFDLLARMPGVESIEIITTEATLASGFHQRLHEWLPGLEETTDGDASGQPAARPFLERACRRAA